MSLTFADLLTPEATSTIRGRLVTALTADGVPVASWAPSSAGGVENLRLDMVAGTLAQLMAQRIGNMVAGRMLALATDDPVKGNWLTFLGKKFYKLEKRAATKTIQNVALYTAASPPSSQPSYTFQPGDLLVASTLTGKKYRSITGGQFSSANVIEHPLMVQFEAENAGSSYNDPEGRINTMVTARAGVRCTNIPPSDFTDAKLTGTSTGSVFALEFGAPPPSIRIRIDATGDIGTATFSYSLDGGATPWVPAGPIPSGYNSFFVGALLAFSNGSTPSFIAGDIFTMFLGDCILQRGADAETDAAFRQRCRNRWPAISLTPVAGSIDLMCRLASDEVAKTAVDADPNTPGGILLTLASSSGPASAQALGAVEDYILARLKGYQGVPAAGTFTSPAETLQVSPAVALPIIPGGTVKVPKALLASAQTAWATAWNTYLIGIPIGGQTGAIVYLAELLQALADAGAVDVISPTLNGVAADVTVPAGQVATLATPTLVWQPI